ncbi:hypothetical protein F5148DRAFT_1147301 [Russula earlei]|uniref:Uncharacterized protein n=1 Tax=Russula earlei TaxID=71964 RepID=A0ACC0UGU3_9AGAM|nr:hypothetical protein F5148DRAFT_1147301 [Russula earlei]
MAPGAPREPNRREALFSSRADRGRAAISRPLSTQLGSPKPPSPILVGVESQSDRTAVLACRPTRPQRKGKMGEIQRFRSAALRGRKSRSAAYDWCLVVWGYRDCGMQRDCWQEMCEAAQSRMCSKGLKTKTVQSPRPSELSNHGNSTGDGDNERSTDDLILVAGRSPTGSPFEDSPPPLIDCRPCSLVVRAETDDGYNYTEVKGGTIGDEVGVVSFRIAIISFSRRSHEMANVRGVLGGGEHWGKASLARAPPLSVHSLIGPGNRVAQTRDRNGITTAVQWRSERRCVNRKELKSTSNMFVFWASRERVNPGEADEGRLGPGWP